LPDACLADRERPLPRGVAISGDRHLRAVLERARARNIPVAVDDIERAENGGDLAPVCVLDRDVEALGVHLTAAPRLRLRRRPARERWSWEAATGLTAGPCAPGGVRPRQGWRR